MPAASFTPPAAERTLGLEFYITETPGVDGTVKGTPEGFRVTEISNYPLPDPSGQFTVLRISSRNWEQHELGAALARRIGLPPHAIAWSGTKDRRAVAERLASYRGDPPDHELGLSGVELIEAYRAREGLVLGHHYGNSFEIRVEPLVMPYAAAQPAYDATEASLRAYGGFPNFFGPQRFGEVRPITHEVGRALVQGNPQEAVEIYLTEIPTGTLEGRGDAARRAYAQHHDPVRGLAEMPPDYRFERALLERLARGQDARQALHGLSRDLRLLFIHAFQSFLFNRWLSARRRSGISLVSPVVGDRVLRVGRDGTLRGTDPVPVEADNERECVELVARGGARVAGPLVGYDTPRVEGPIGGLLEDLLEHEGVDRAGFRVPFAPEISSGGAWRPILLPTPPISRTTDETGIWFRFALPKGAYATVLLREFLKTGAVPADPTAWRQAY